MFIELVDALRCPYEHEESWLVLGAERMDERHVLDGVLGCPVCRRQYTIAAGVADLRTGPRPAPLVAPSGAAVADPEQAIRLAALLDLTDAGGYAVLVGTWTRHASALQALSDTHLLLVNPEPGVAVGRGTSGLLADRRLPLAAGSARGLAVDAAAGPDFLAAALASVRAGGRVVAPVVLPVPDGVTELVRDASVWVAERSAPASGLVSLARGGR